MIEVEQSLICHVPVMLRESIEWLRADAGGIFLDCTFGGGGHTEAILDANDGNFVYSIDRDPEAKVRARELSVLRKNFVFYQTNFADSQFLKMPPLDGIIMDLGVSSFQLDSPDRGFSFKDHVILDMRMDNTIGITADEFLRTACERDLITAIRDYGEEEDWKKVVHLVVKNRKNPELRYSDTFAKMISRALSYKKRSKIHPATKTFQGIRIFINDELGSIERALPIMFDRLKAGGRLVVISFHSLEDRIIKRFFNKVAGKAVDRFDSEYQQNRISLANILTKKPICPTEGEIANNDRSRSAKMRVLEKVLDCPNAKK